MTKIFRNIRKSMTSDNRVSKYLMYAIGEVILVVIGIIIAVSINDWNKSRIQQDEIDHLLLAFEKDLKANIQESTNTIAFALHRDSLARMALNGEVTEEMYQNHEVDFIILNYANTQIFEDNLDRILAKEDLVPNDYQSLLAMLKTYKEQIQDEEEISERVLDFIFGEITFATNNLPWFSYHQDTIPPQGIHYFMHDSIYRNKVQLYHILLVRNHMSTQASRRNTEINILFELRQKHHGNVGSIETELAALGMHQLKQTDLSKAVVLNDDSKLHTMPLIYNMTQDTLTFKIPYYFRKMHSSFIQTLAPGEALNEAPYFAHYIERMEGEEVVERYLPQPHSYLLFK